MRNCMVCIHDNREEIDKALLAKVTYRNIQKQYGVNISTLSRHKKDHLPKELIKSEKLKEIAKSDTLIEQVQTLKNRAEDILDKVEQQGSHTIALQAIKEIRSIIELLAKIQGEIQTGVTINLNPEWIELRTVIINAVEQYPEAKKAILKAIDSKGG